MYRETKMGYRGAMVIYEPCSGRNGHLPIAMRRGSATATGRHGGSSDVAKRTDGLRVVAVGAPPKWHAVFTVVALIAGMYAASLSTAAARGQTAIALESVATQSQEEPPPPRGERELGLFRSLEFMSSNLVVVPQWQQVARRIEQDRAEIEARESLRSSRSR